MIDDKFLKQLEEIAEIMEKGTVTEKATAATIYSLISASYIGCEIELMHLVNNFGRQKLNAVNNSIQDQIAKLN